MCRRTSRSPTPTPHDAEDRNTPTDPGASSVPARPLSCSTPLITCAGEGLVVRLTATCRTDSLCDVVITMSSERWNGILRRLRQGHCGGECATVAAAGRAGHLVLLVEGPCPVCEDVRLFGSVRR